MMQTLRKIDTMCSNHYLLARQEDINGTTKMLNTVSGKGGLGRWPREVSSNPGRAGPADATLAINVTELSFLL